MEKRRRHDGRATGHQKRSPDQKKFGPLEKMEQSHWQSFIEDLIPRGIIQLFFFDGEKDRGNCKGRHGGCDYKGVIQFAPWHRDCGTAFVQTCR